MVYKIFYRKLMIYKLFTLNLNNALLTLNNAGIHGIYS